MFGLGVDTIVKYVAILVLGIAALFGVNHVMNLKADLVTAEQNTERLKESAIFQGQVIAKQEQEIMQIQNTNENLTKRNAELDKQVKDLDKKFTQKANGDPRDLGVIARKKPGLVNNTVNNATVNANRCFELATGAKLKQGETNAECKDLANSSNN